MTLDIMECGEVCCEYCTKNKCIYIKDEKSNDTNNNEDKKLDN